MSEDHPEELYGNSVVHSGFLLKKSPDNVITPWQRRMFWLLSNGTMAYAEEKKGRETTFVTKGRIQVADYDCVKDDQPTRFRLVPREGPVTTRDEEERRQQQSQPKGRIYEFEATNETVRDAWCEQLKSKISQIGQEYRGALVLGDYDIMFDVDSIKKVSEGWPVFVSDFLRRKIIYKIGENYTSQEFLQELQNSMPLSTGGVDVIVSFLGLYNKGKTFCLNHLAGNEVSLKSGNRYSTKGLSFLLSKPGGPSNVLWMDTAGLNSPVSSVGKIELADKKAMDLFINDVVVELSDVIIVVINELTWADQEFIESLRYSLIKQKQNSKLNTKLFVVHNFKKIDKEADLKTMWRKCALRTFQGQALEQIVEINGQKKISRYMLCPAEGPESVEVCHFFLAREDSAAGREVNRTTFKLLSEKIQYGVVRQRRQATLVPYVLDVLSKSLNNYCIGKTELSLAGTIAEEIVEPVALPDSWDHITDVDMQVDRFSCSLCRIISNGPVELSRGQIAFDGLHYSLDRSFPPPFDVIESDDTLYIIMDFPGYEEGNPNTGSLTITPREMVIDGAHHLFLRFSGKRELFFTKDDNLVRYADCPVKSIYLEYSRQGGEFAISVRISRNVMFNEMKVLFEMGICQVCLPKEIVSKSVRQINMGINL